MILAERHFRFEWEFECDLLGGNRQRGLSELQALPFSSAAGLRELKVTGLVKPRRAATTVADRPMPWEGTRYSTRR